MPITPVESIITRYRDTLQMSDNYTGCVLFAGLTSICRPFINGTALDDEFT